MDTALLKATVPSESGSEKLRKEVVDLCVPAGAAYISIMRSNFVSLHPYFKVQPGKLEAVKAGFPRFVEKTAKEKKNVFYGFTVNGDEVFCREAYVDAQGVLAHLDNIGTLLAELLKMADLIRFEVHGPAK